MKKIFKLLVISTMVLLLGACGSLSKEERQTLKNITI